MFDLVRYSPFGNRFYNVEPADQLWPWLREYSVFDAPFAAPAAFGTWQFGRLDNFFTGDNLAIDLQENDRELVVKADLPGVPPENIEVEVQKEMLTVRARQEADRRQEQPGWRIYERRLGIWQRSLKLPLEVDAERANAALRDGVLTVTLPKVEPHKNLIHRIKVNLAKLAPSTKKKGQIKVITR